MTLRLKKDGTAHDATLEFPFMEDEYLGKHQSRSRDGDTSICDAKDSAASRLSHMIGIEYLEAYDLVVKAELIIE